MRRLLLLSLLALPLAAQYPAGAVFQRGDDPRWASPNFDDRQWVKQSEYRANSYDDYLQNRSWMRARVTIPAGEPAVIVSQHCPCEFYVNGLRVGAIGDLNQARPETPREVRIFPLPASIPPGEAVFAVRRYDPPGLENVNYAWARSSAMVVAASREGEALVRFAKNISASAQINFLVTLIALAALLGATLGQRKDAAFWVAILMQGCTLLAIGFGSFELGGISEHSRLNSLAWLFGGWTLTLPAVIILMLAPVLNLRLWLPICLLVIAVRLPYSFAAFYAVPPFWLPLAVFFVEIGTWLNLVTTLGVVIITFQRRSIPYPLLLISLLAPLSGLFARSLSSMLRLPEKFFFFDTMWTWPRLTQVLYSLTVAALVIWRAQVRRGQELRQQEELAAAKEVQSLLLASPYQANPEIQIESAYLPASAVGGDFYYVRGFTDGSRVTLVGDVSGKGLKAAMVVSVAIGILRTVKSSSPGEILATMNEGLAGQTGNGFVTACCARFDSDGSAVLANAGHPAPYVDGREAEFESGLPLGVVAGVVYEESVWRGEQFTFVSDGVLEAENAQRELFGFDRTREISPQSAQEIAEAAKAWGQNDDITVVTVRRLS